MPEFDLSPCYVYWGVAGAEASLGMTFGGVNVSIQEQKADVKFDQAGDVPVDKVHMGYLIEITCNLAEVSVDLFSTIMQGAAYTIDGTKEKAVITPPIGANDRDYHSGSLILKRVINGIASADPNDWFTYPVASPSIMGDMNFNATNQRAIPVKFTCYQRETLGVYSDIMTVGDETAT